ncbi:zf-CCHC domain-containing protein [Tanacetum coccineum]
MATIRFENNHFATITGYGNYVQGNITICHVYYVKGLGHNLFSVGQFGDGDLEVSFRSKTCYVQNLEGDYLLIGARESNLYTISISGMAASSPVCLMSKATLTNNYAVLGRYGVSVPALYKRPRRKQDPIRQDLKTKFLSKYCPPARTAKKMEEINNFQQEPYETLYQAWEQFKELLMKCPQHYLTKMQEVILFYNGLDVQTRQILDSKGAISSKTVADAKVAIQEMAEYSQKWHNGTSRTRSTKTSDGLAAIQVQLNNLGREIKKVNEKVYAAEVGCEQCKGPHYTKDCPLKEEALGFYQRNNANPSYQERRQPIEETLSNFMSESANRHEENSNMIKEIRASTDAAVRNQRASIKTLEIQIGKISKVPQERGFGSLASSTEANPRDHVKSISTTAEADSNPIRRIGSP